MQYIKSLLNYTGGKYKILDSIFKIFPSNINTFVDLFAGGLNVGINVEANNIIANDCNSYLIELYKYFSLHEVAEIKREIHKRIDMFQLSKTNVEGYNALREQYNRDKNIIDFFVLICYSFNHQIRFNKNYDFNVSFGRYRSSYNDRIERNLVRFCEALHDKSIQLFNKDFAKLDLSELKENDLVYCDPPYLISTASYNEHGKWTEKEEIKLFNLLDKLNQQHIHFALSNVLYHKGLSNDLLIEWSQKYNIHYIDKSYTNCSYHKKDKESKTVEVIITNYKI